MSSGQSGETTGEESWGADLQSFLEEIPEGGGIYLIHLREGEPYLGRTSILRRRLQRLFGTTDKPSRIPQLRTQLTRVDYWRASSQLEMSLRLWELARIYRSTDYRKFLKLRSPHWLRLSKASGFARTYVTTHLTAAGSNYGPFTSRAAAEAFEHAVLDLFQLRRCIEDLAPSPDHPGCIYGEMNKCLRPCQQTVSIDEYDSEARRVALFMETNGARLLDRAMQAREQASVELDFEKAAGEHKQVERIEAAIKLRNEIAQPLERLTGVAVCAGVEPQTVCLFVMAQGEWQQPVSISLAPTTDKPISLDRRLKETLATVAMRASAFAEREDHCAIFMRWYLSSWRDGTWLPFSDFDRVPWRKLVNAVGKAAR